MAASDNVALIKRWEETFNNDVEALTNELYAPECRIMGMMMGREKLLRFERKVLAVAPKRSIRVDQAHGAGDVVTVEGVLLDPDQGADWKLPFCAVLTFKDGQVVSDNTYTEYSKWPGMH